MLIEGDCREVVRSLEADSFDALVTDPPAGISFMGKKFDTFASRQDFVLFLTDVMSRCLAVLKPGAHALVWALPRTSHWTATAIENAGFEIRDVVTHLFGSGFPKSLDVSKAIDKAAGADRPVVGANPNFRDPDSDHHERWNGAVLNPNVTTAATAEARRWTGWGTALKPAAEHWILCRKPLSEPTVAANVLKWGVGALNIDAGRVAAYVPGGGGGKLWSHYRDGTDAEKPRPSEDHVGRWPANLALTHHHKCRLVGSKTVKGDMHFPADREPSLFGRVGGQALDERRVREEQVEDWQCHPECPIKMLDEQAGPQHSGGTPPASRRCSASKTKNCYGDFNGEENPEGIGSSSGNVSRFFYCAKASREERNFGCQDLSEKPIQWSSGEQNPGSWQHPGTKKTAQNNHPTVKPVDLMDWLLRLIVPPGGKVLDPFAGSGTTEVAAIAGDWQCVSIEQDPEYAAIARARIEAATRQRKSFLF